MYFKIILIIIAIPLTVLGCASEPQQDFLEGYIEHYRPHNENVYSVVVFVEDAESAVNDEDMHELREGNRELLDYTNIRVVKFNDRNHVDHVTYFDTLDTPMYIMYDSEDFLMITPDIEDVKRIASNN
ncbi:hypothetical protein J2R98_001661 [Alkalibacillus filiformis]|uniref:DUF4174 domain-containing protein n=1 Tax=Alkalibacillus filiformis TaxID=200990 RepID=A0ABU0DTP4_9BACI|nr:hypothetical protein [Alkalibacillus filiformis]MDQ0351829.1 hypothetical protein [Alkalibacillus filiformis]